MTIISSAEIIRRKSSFIPNAESNALDSSIDQILVNKHDLADLKADLNEFHFENYELMDSKVYAPLINDLLHLQEYI